MTSRGIGPTCMTSSEPTPSSSQTNRTLVATSALVSTTTPEQHAVHLDQIQAVSLSICLFLAFFQLCYKVPERAINLLLSFISALVIWLSTFMDSQLVPFLKDMIPSNMYFLRKKCRQDSKMKMYVVCPKCCALYEMKDCFEKRKGDFDSATCSNVEYPNHTQPMRRIRCNALLMKKVKCRSKYKLKPRKIYLYNSLKSSIEKLINRPKFLKMCEHWRNRQNDANMYADIIYGRHLVPVLMPAAATLFLIYQGVLG